MPCGPSMAAPIFLETDWLTVTKENEAMSEDSKKSVAMLPAGGLAPGQRWSAARKREVVLRLLRGEPIEALSRELGIEIYRLEKWREKALSGIDTALKERENDPVQAELSAAMRRIGELTMQNELLWQRVRKPGPLAKRRSSK